MKKYNYFKRVLDNQLDLDFTFNFINSFFKEIMNPLNDNQVVCVIVRVEYDKAGGSMIRTFSPLTGITKNDKFILHLFNTVKGYIGLNINHYEQYDPKSIIIDYYISD